MSSNDRTNRRSLSSEPSSGQFYRKSLSIRDVFVSFLCQILEYNVNGVDACNQSDCK